jgi:hypothetical protein
MKGRALPGAAFPLFTAAFEKTTVVFCRNVAV